MKNAKAQMAFLVSGEGHSMSLLTLGIFLMVGIVVLADYGISVDTPVQRHLAFLTHYYVFGGDDDFLSQHPTLFQYKDRIYGVAFEMLLLYVEKILVLEDSRDVYLTRHLVTHIFFLVGGLACYFLAYRLFNNRFLALFAMFLFLLHPRIYAHSFFNSKDIPFLSMFMITLFLIQRGFRQDTVSAFLICGIGIGILTNIRILGVMLFAAVLAMRACDYFYASGREEKKHILITSGGVVFVSVLTLYATWPYLWGDPINRFIESFTQMANYPYDTVEYFQGNLISSTNPPFNYIPTWVLITTPPVTILLGIIGMISVFGRGFICPRDILRNTPLRFGFLLVACFMLPILAVIVLHSTLYNGWRQMYFLYAPFSMLAIFGLHDLLTYSNRRFGKYVVMFFSGTGIVTTIISMILLHPFQHLHFNFLVDRTTPGHLIQEYYMWHWGTGALTALYHLTEQYPSSSISIHEDAIDDSGIVKGLWLLPKQDRERIIFSNMPDRNGDPFYYYYGGALFATRLANNEIKHPLTYKYEIYNNIVFGWAKLE